MFSALTLRRFSLYASILTRAGVAPRSLMLVMNILVSCSIAVRAHGARDGNTCRRWLGSAACVPAIHQAVFSPKNRPSRSPTRRKLRCAAVLARASSPLADSRSPPLLPGAGDGFTQGNPPVFRVSPPPSERMGHPCRHDGWHGRASLGRGCSHTAQQSWTAPPNTSSGPPTRGRRKR